MEIRNGNVSFNKFKGSGPRTDRAEVVFSGAVTQAAAILRGFDVRFSPKSDHHFGKLEVTLKPRRTTSAAACERRRHLRTTRLVEQLGRQLRRRDHVLGGCRVGAAPVRRCFPIRRLAERKGRCRRFDGAAG